MNNFLILSWFFCEKSSLNVVKSKRKKQSKLYFRNVMWERKSNGKTIANSLMHSISPTPGMMWRCNPFTDVTYITRVEEETSGPTQKQSGPTFYISDTNMGGFRGWVEFVIRTWISLFSLSKFLFSPSLSFSNYIVGKIEFIVKPCCEVQSNQFTWKLLSLG